MKRFLFLAACFLAGLVAPIHAADSTESSAIRAVLAAQAEAWNRGDIDGFMQGYWKSDQLRFASGGNVTFGWQTTLERYKKHYPDKATMGTLAFTIEEVKLLAPDAAVVFGKWELTREKDKPWGLFTLTFRKIDGAWRIVSDHTSSAAEK